MPDPPHAYPFRLVEPRGGDVRGDAPIVVPSLGSSLPRQSVADHPLSLAVEAMAQSVLVAPPPELRGGGAAPEGAQLAGIEDARLLSAIVPGDRLEAHAEVTGRFGPAAKVRCRLERDGEPVAEATLLLTVGG